ncbi:sigma-54-dependent transcriptional regulator [Aliamphritea hakodatensis]|uniref:sigma-54-dependent transcriptional regulator n=1 Tax=Aliamphritea hakodatensis TaxID=2895352 RepID=UPI0022FD8784|nr:sigma-54 dependent transcriptional regulator [Aliamphritea hakodatensis]
MPVGTASFSVLIVDDEPGICDFLARALRKKYAVVDVAADSSSADKLRASRLYDLLIVDINMPGLSGLEWVSRFNAELPSEVIFMTGFAELDNAVAAVRIGASDFILKPFRLEQMLGAVERCYQRLKLSRENQALQHRLTRHYADSSLIGDSAAMQAVNGLISRVAATPASILIEGETGTGKELVASELHRQSGRSGAFVPVNCAAVAPELAESELFGHIQGAFTGAAQARQGVFDYADGGTLFLDEISEMPLALQGKLLRVLEEAKIRPLGTDREKSVDVRIVAASNKPLEALVEQKLFRADLYYRLNILPIELPPLRERLEDIPLLATLFTRQLAEELGLSAPELHPGALQALQGYHWPGNVRELRNLLERSILLGCAPAELLSDSVTAEHAGYPLNWSLAQVQVRHIEQVLQHCEGNKSRAARQLGITRKTLDRKRRDLDASVGAGDADVDLIPGL